MSFFGHLLVHICIMEMYWWWKGEIYGIHGVQQSCFWSTLVRVGWTPKKSEADWWVYEMDFVVCVKILTPFRDSYRVCLKDFVMSCWSGNHPQNNLAKVCYIQDMKLAKQEKKTESLFILGYLLLIIKIWWFQFFSFEIW